jgi:hypothetical protein
MGPSQQHDRDEGNGEHGAKGLFKVQKAWEEPQGVGWSGTGFTGLQGPRQSSRKGSNLPLSSP